MTGDRRSRALGSGSVALGALAVAALGAAIPVVELLVFRHLGGSPVRGPSELDGTVSGGSEDLGLLRWVWLENSLSAGVGAAHPDETLPRQAAALVSAQGQCAVELICLAVPGASAGDALAKQVPLALSALSEGVTAVLTVGCNDVPRLVRPRAFRVTYTAIVDALDAIGAGVILIGVPDLGSMTVVMAQPLRWIVGLAARYMDNIVREVAAQTGARYVSIADGPLRGHTSRQPARRVLSADRFHPNGVGYGIWAGRVAPALLQRQIRMTYQPNGSGHQARQAGGT